MDAVPHDSGAPVKPWLSFPPQPQRQDSLNDQLRELAMVAARLGMYDAGDFIQRALHPNRTWGHRDAR